MKKIMFVILVMLIILTGCSNRVTVESKSQALQQVTSGAPSSGYVTPFSKSISPTISPIPLQEAVSPPISEEDNIIQLSMVSMESGFALTEGSHVLKTIDGGLTWSDIYMIEDSDMMTGIYPVIEAISDNTLYLVAQYNNHTNFMKTTDGGNTWSSTTIYSEMNWVNDDIGDYAMDFIDTDNGYILINCTPAAGQMYKALFKTTDAGRNWIMLCGDKGCDDNLTGITPSGINGYPDAISFINHETGWITSGSNGAFPYGLFINKTDDGGKTWCIIDYPEFPKEYSDTDGEDIYVGASKSSFYGKDNQNGKLILYFHLYAQGEDDTAYMYSYTEEDTWKLDGKCNIIISEFRFMDDKNGIGLDIDGKVCTTKDGGLTWSKVE